MSWVLRRAVLTMSWVCRRALLAALLVAVKIISSLSWSEHILAFANAVQKVCDNIWRSLFALLGVMEYPDPVLLTFLLILLVPWFASAFRDQPPDLSRIKNQKLFHDKFIVFLTPRRSILAEPQTIQTIAREWLEWAGSVVTLSAVVWVFDMWTYAILVAGLITVLFIGRRIENSFHKDAWPSRDPSNNEKVTAAVTSIVCAWIISLPLIGVWLGFNIFIGRIDFAEFATNSWATSDFLWVVVLAFAMALLVHCAFFEKRYFSRFGTWILGGLILAKLVDYGDQVVQTVING